jgi:hypothetical protein
MNGQPDAAAAAFLNWQDYVRKRYATLIVENGGIIDADATGFTVHCGDGVRTIKLNDGLLSTDYKNYAPLLNDGGKATLATGVLKNRLRSTSWIDFDIAWRHLSNKLGNRPEEEWLPGLVEERGFDAIAAEMGQAIRDFHLANPRALMATPRWTGNLLIWRAIHWRFRNQKNGPVRILLDALENGKWPLFVKLSSLRPDQVHDAARYLRRKTRPHIDWHASNAGALSWSTR